jgi:hypothetical protein
VRNILEGTDHRHRHKTPLSLVEIAKDVKREGKNEDDGGAKEPKKALPNDVSVLAPPKCTFCNVHGVIKATVKHVGAQDQYREEDRCDGDPQDHTCNPIPIGQKI